MVRSLVLMAWLFAAFGNTQAQTASASHSKANPHAAASCTKDAECPSGQRCGFTFGCKSKGKCIVPSGTPSCIDPGGRCGCDGRPVEIFCAIDSRIEYTSAPANAVGPCPRTCAENSECGSGLVCRNATCVKP